MKRYLKILVCITSFCIFAGCDNKNLQDAGVEINTNIEKSVVNVEFDEKKYKCKFTCLECGESVVTFEEPEDLKGLSFKRHDGEYEISNKNLVGKFSAMPIQKNSFMNMINDVINEAKTPENLELINYEEGERTYKIKNMGPKWQMTVDNSGKIIFIGNEDMKFGARIDYDV